MNKPNSFPHPDEVGTPPGAEGWQEMYPYYMLFSDERQKEEDKFWFCDTMHWTEPLYPFDAITAENAIHALGQYNSRVFQIPSSLGVDIRILNGYVYLSPVAVKDAKKIKERLREFHERAGYYYQNWEKLYDIWKDKVTEEINTLKDLVIAELPEKEKKETVTEAIGLASGYYLIKAFNRIIDSVSKIWQYHFEFLNLGYAAYLDLSIFMKDKFPDISDQTITKMVAGIDVILFRPDKELKNLARLAAKLKLDEIFIDTKDTQEIIQKLEAIESGRAWLRALDKVKDPWFYYNTGTGFHHTPRSWIDDLSAPFSGIKSYLKKMAAGQNIERPLDQVLHESNRLVEGHLSLLKSAEDKKAFSEKVALAKMVFPYVEEHNFYIEHWHHTIFWNKMREIGRIFEKNKFIKTHEDVFYLNRYEISQALYDMYAYWAIGTQARGPTYWPKIVSRRKKIIKALRKHQPVPALGNIPEKITEPFTVMLWGIVSEKISYWLEISKTKNQRNHLIKGHPASPGTVEGIARVVLSAAELETVQPGEILVCPITAPSWAPAFSKITAVVTNVGGMMSHASILCREYRIPAVVGTGFATQVIKNGQRLRVNGENGVVEIL